MRRYLVLLSVIVVVGVSCKKADGSDNASTAPDNQEKIEDTLPPLVVGLLDMAGQGCAALSDPATVEITPTTLVFKVETEVEKDLAPTFRRSSCTLAVPLSVPAGYKMIVDLVESEAILGLADQGMGSGQVEVFKAGETGKPLLLESASSLQQVLSVNPEVETACGDQLNLRANASLILKGGTGVSTARWGEIKLTYRLEACP